MREHWLFKADWCQSCQRLRESDVYQQAIESLPPEQLEIVDVDGNPHIVGDHEIARIPQMIVYEQPDADEQPTEEIKRVLGASDIETELRRLL